MTKVYGEVSGGRCLITAQGHATGSPQVCAVVSALLSAVDGYLSQHPDMVIRRELASADVVLEFEATAQSVFDVAMIGLIQIEMAHPEFISVEIGK